MLRCMVPVRSAYFGFYTLLSFAVFDDVAREIDLGGSAVFT